MTIEESINNAVKLFYSYYLNENKERIDIGKSVLEENKLGGNDFWEVVCPTLKRQGILKEFSSIVFPKHEAGRDMLELNNEEFSKKLNSLPKYFRFIVNGAELKRVNVENLRRFRSEIMQKNDDVNAKTTRSNDYNENELRIKRDSLLKIKRVLNCIQKKRETEHRTVFEIEWRDFLDAGQGLIRRESEIESVINKVAEENGGIDYERTVTKDDIDASFVIYVITITDSVAFENYHNKIVDQFKDIEPVFQKIKQEEKGDFVEPTNLEQESNPFCEVNDGIGYLRFNKHGQKIKIGKEKTRHFKLLQCLLNPIGVYKTIEVVFEKMQLPKDGNNKKFWDANTGKTAKITIIEYAKKELQKDGKLKGKIIFSFSSNKSQIKAAGLK